MPSTGSIFLPMAEAVIATCGSARQYLVRHERIPDSEMVPPTAKHALRALSSDVNVVFLFLDSMSRRHFFRTMPQVCGWQIAWQGFLLILFLRRRLRWSIFAGTATNHMLRCSTCRFFDFVYVIHLPTAPIQYFSASCQWFSHRQQHGGQNLGI